MVSCLSGGSDASWDALLGMTQRTQYPLIKEYTLNHNIKAPII